MKQTMLRMLACLVLLLAAPVTLCLLAFELPAQYGDTFLGELPYKVDLLAETEGKRIVVIGGSGVAFSQRSDLLEAELDGYSVINFGMYAGLGSTVMLDLAENFIREGDIVIFSPEQSRQTLSMYFSPESMWQAADGRFELLSHLPGKDLGAMAGQLPYFAADKYQYYRSGTAPAPEGIYRREAFNEYGDIGDPQRARNIMAGGYDPDMMIDFSTELPSEEFLSRVNAFVAACEDRGARFFYRFCPMNALAVTEDGWVQADSYFEHLQEVLDCEFLGSPRDSILDAQWFYDTNFHLNSAGAVVNTAAMAAELKTALGDSAPVEITLPEMPEFADVSIVSGDNSHAGFFLYETEEGTVRIVGLTEEGKQQEQLTVPVSHNGNPVTMIDSSVFAGNETIREIVIQENMNRIADGSFAGCTALERLVIRNVSPEKCVVGQHLLDGTACLVYVPAESFSAYQTNYFWSVHAGRIRGEAMDLPQDQPEVPDIPVTAGLNVTYHVNGGVLKYDSADTVTLTAANTHLRFNTAQGTRYMQRPGYQLIGWNTMPDGSGVSVGLGSRMERAEDLVLYAQWAKENPAGDFTYTAKGEEIHITAYFGSDAWCVVPERIDGKKVTRICTGAFQNAEMDTLVLPPSIFTVERDAFAGSTVREVYLYDALHYIYDASFAGCRNLTTLHMNAVTAPVYSGSYYDGFSDRYDWLLSIREDQKIVLFSGSSGRYGYCSEMLMEAFPEYQVANMGVYAFTNAMPQLELIRPLMQPGDILLSAPEFDAVDFQFCTTNALDSHFWAMMESNYDAVALLDMRNYSSIFDSLREYLTVRPAMDAGDYSISPNWFDDDGNRYDYDTYNQYGDFVLERPNAPRDEIMKWGLADYTVEGFPEETIHCLNRVYEGFLSDGITVYFSYTPRNIRAITPESTADARQALHEHLREHLMVPVISSIEESLYPGTCFYLIDSHLSTEAAVVRTQRTIEALQMQFDLDAQNLQ